MREGEMCLNKAEQACNAQLDALADMWQLRSMIKTISTHTANAEDSHARQ